MILGVPFVEGESFEDERGKLFGRFVVKFEEADLVMETLDLSVVEPAEHDVGLSSALHQPVDGVPFEAHPSLRIVIWCKNRNDKV